MLTHYVYDCRQFYFESCVSYFTCSCYPIILQQKSTLSCKVHEH
uniref:Uncharacterized protein n=1 Tax=Arundo donax TaxID=35708 RepID=A0A0A9HNT5_ARUDO